MVGTKMKRGKKTLKRNRYISRARMSVPDISILRRLMKTKPAFAVDSLNAASGSKGIDNEAPFDSGSEGLDDEATPRKRRYISMRNLLARQPETHKMEDDAPADSGSEKVEDEAAPPK
ncbi:hypothetical protein KP509_03G055700 [Ceratopteris richardii]|uniref:Uncharacterized protein n=1 Tax=Ceratopteris richardii TaxID=49495 RepID=A0A8T2VBQ5_CERRI|nr:hypothetical protein KP509_03G055700 [Ceratopteris richardii]